MIVLIIGLVLFFGMHSVTLLAPRWRERQVSRFGEKRWKGFYAIISIAGLVLIVNGYESARQAPLFVYLAPYWLRHVSWVLLLPVFPLLLATYFPGRIKAAVRHPMLVATAIWAFAHLLTNGTVADVFLFGAFLAWALSLIATAGSRPARAIPGAPASPANDAIAVVAGLALYAVTGLWAHRALFGIPAFF